MSKYKKIRNKVMAMLLLVAAVLGCFMSSSVASIAATEGDETIKIACVGDSLTEGYTSSGGLKGATAYPAVLQNMLGEGYEVGNFGKTGFTLLKGTDKSYWNTTEYANSKTYDADIVIIMLGSNDSKPVYWNEEQFKEDAVALVNAYQGLESNPEIIFATSPQCYRTTGDPITPDTVAAVYEVQKELITENGWKSVDMYALTADREDLYNTDKLHFTDEGYAYVAECMYEAITGEAPVASGSLTIPHTQTSGSTNYFTFAEGKWTAGSDSHTWSTAVDSTDPRSTWYEVNFTGNKIDVYAGKNYMMGKVEYFVDDISYGIFDLYNGSNINSTLITTISGLEEGMHTFRAEATGERNASGRGNIAVDAAQIVVYSDNMAVLEPSMGVNISRMFNNTTDPGNNTWVFTGGEAVQGTYEQIGGARNYIGHFEEYARNQKSLGNDPTRQRYTINTAKKGQQLSEIIQNWDEKVTKFDPRAVAYMVGVEDYGLGIDHIDEFKESLVQFIDKALTEKKNNGSFAVIQKPFAVQNAETNTIIEAYCAAVDEVVAEYKADVDQYENIVVIDHYAQTKDKADFKDNKLNADGSLNELGHLEIGRQLVAAIMQIETEYPCRQGVRMGQTAEEQPEQYLDVQPSVTAGNKCLYVEIPAGAGEDWKYSVDMDGMTVSAEVSGNSFKISGLVNGKDYVLKIQSTDGTKQLTTVKGVINVGESAVKDEQELNENQQKLADLMAEKDSLTWLFMGDSITHGLVYTYGYGGTAQMFEKFLKDDLGRMDDVVINTAVSGAHTVSTLNNIDQRLKKYVPDVVAIMLGTNDAYPDLNDVDPGLPITADEYEENLRTIIAHIREVNPDAVIVLRSPTPMTSDDGRKANALVNIERMKKVASEDESLIYVDQYTAVNEALETYAWLDDNNQFFLGNWLHPGINGQIVMTKQFIKACGLWTEDSAITNLYYEAPITEENVKITPTLLTSSNFIGVSSEKLPSDSNLSIGSVTVKATAGAQTYTVTAKAGEEYAALTGIPNQTYEVEVSAYLKDTAKKVIFEKQNVTILSEHKSEEIIRLAGADRYETGYKVADVLKETLGVEKFEAVVVATGKNFADALSGSYLAAEKNAPILLTNGKDANIAELHAYIRNHVTAGGKVYILGGLEAVPANAEKIEGYDVVRLSGETRYDTNLAILKEAGVQGDSVIIATGKSFADSLSASAAKLPILLVKPDSTLSYAQKAVLKGTKNIYIIGGEEAVSESYAKELAAYGEVTRVSGKTRYETSIAVAKTFFGDVDEAVIASGKNFPDGLCGGPLAAARNVPLILTADGKTDAATEYAAQEVITSGYVLGGTEALADESVVVVFGLESAEDIILK